LNWNAKNVLKAFIKASIHAHVETNCLVSYHLILCRTSTIKIDIKYICCRRRLTM
jgi:hypothetical protein